jgi:hypothetical protein
MPEFAITGGPFKLTAGGHPSSNLVVRFYSREVPLIQRFPIWVDQMGGKPVEGATEFVDYVQISHPGESLNVIDRRATDEDKKRFPHEWDRYRSNRDQAPNGIPMRRCSQAIPTLSKH